MRFREINSQQGAELELAPMIDVVFLLLIFFIVSWQSARFERDMDISVPSAEEAENKDRQAGEIIINVRKDGTVILNGLEVTEEQLLAKLVAVSEAFPDQAVILRGSSEASFQAIIDVLDHVKKAGIWNVAFATTRPEK
ncbi:MAG: biopolymer transporter ExbD [Verrucomicrobiales bacterium]|mgnify:CR=1 FL=1|jgi:biopolymer transport protein ExbD|nr:biopolymer transporter ExbD [Verrucomicrobiales bacterium]MBP9224123.1 biopolymer transporter ExbD [Verrucomicrobiales bacterium]